MIICAASPRRELFCIITGGDNPGTANYNAFYTLSYSGEHFSNYASLSSYALTILNDCELDVTIAARTTGTNVKAEEYKLVRYPGGDGAEEVLLALNGTAKQTDSGRIRLSAGDVLKGYQKRASTTGAVRMFEAWIINPSLEAVTQ